jgi:hypothetical protein
LNKIVLLSALACALLVAACGDDDDDSDDPRIGQVGALSENATYAYADAGPAGLYDYMSTAVTQQCTAENFEADMEGEPVPTGWRQTKNFEFGTDDTATATVILITDEGDVEQEWTFVLEGESWRISDLPGLEDCAPA